MYQREWIGIILTILALGFVVYANLASGNMHKKKVEDKVEPISQPVDTTVIITDHMIYHEWNSHVDSVLLHRLDAVMDSMNMDCGK